MMARTASAAAVLIVAATLAASADGAIRLPAVLSDGMVVQRDSTAPIWGWAAPGATVTVDASWGATGDATVDARGRWRVDLPTPPAGGPFEIAISGDDATTIHDVLAGEVWICSGQSNMEWPLAATDDAEAAVAAANHPTIRLFQVANAFAAQPRTDCKGAWSACTPESAAGFSAVGYHFGRALQEATKVPIGLIDATWGGTRVESWTPAGALVAFPELGDELAVVQAIADPIKRDTIARSRAEGWWLGLDARGPFGTKWIAPDFDDSGWSTMDLPATLGPDGLDSFDGIVYFRRTFELPGDWASRGATLSLGPIDDYDDVFVNGVRVGGVHEANRWNQPRVYEIPSGVLKAGTNHVGVRVLDTAGPGGINGAAEQMELRAGDRHVALAGPWRWARGLAAKALPPQPLTDLNANSLTALYNGMIEPIAPYGIRGAIWYQGESNRNVAPQYAQRFPAMIRAWRERFGRGDFPFYFVQIAPFEYGGDAGETAELRRSQEAALALPATGMVVTMDVGNPADIHPRDKRTVGDRLARLARRDLHGESSLEASGPVAARVERRGAELVVHFTHADGLRAGADGLPHFELAGADGAFAPATATIAGATVVLRAEGVTAPTQARHLWSAAPKAALFNGAGMPAGPFWVK